MPEDKIINNSKETAIFKIKLKLDNRGYCDSYCYLAIYNRLYRILINECHRISIFKVQALRNVLLLDDTYSSIRVHRSTMLKGLSLFSYKNLFISEINTFARISMEIRYLA